MTQMIKYKDNIDIYYQNVRGLRSKINDFRLEILENSYPIVALTETWLNSSINNFELFPHHYNVLRCDRDVVQTGKSRGGGVLLAVVDSIKIQRLSDLETNGDNIWARLKISKHFSIVLALVYFPPNTHISAYKLFFEKLDYFATKKENIIVLGDFNLNIFGPEYDLSRGNEICKQLLFFCKLHNLSLKNKVLNVLGKTLDLVLSNINDLDVKQESNPLVKIDVYHPALLIESKMLVGGYDCDREGLSPMYDFARADFLSLYYDIANCDWTDLLKTSNINIAVNVFYDKLFSILNLHVPLRKCPSKKHPPWFSYELKIMLKKKNKLRKRFKKYQLPHIYDQFRQVRSDIKRKIRQDHDLFINKIESDLLNNPKSFWGVMKKMRASDSSPSVMYLGDKEFEGSDKIAEALADYFHSVYDPNVLDLDELVRRALCSPIMENIDCLFIDKISEIEVLNSLKKLKSKLSLGPDNIPPYILKGCSDILVKPLHYLFNLSLKSNSFPDFWKIAKVVPIPKKGASRDISNHRPIAVLSSPAKVFECILYNRLFAHIKKFITPFQHGFFPGRSINSNLVNFCQYTMNFVDKNVQVDCIYTHFEKAFDNHSILLSKLHYYGLCENTVKFFSTYLFKRRQFVKYKGSCSKEFVVTSGVPQGSNLGPLMFLIFINDISKHVTNSKILMYADDLKIFRCVKNVDDCQLLQSDIDRLIAWSNNNLSFNVKKCAVMSYTRKSEQSMLNFPYNMNSTLLDRRSTFKDLGVVFDSKLLFSDHVVATCKAAYSVLGFIFRSSSFLKNINSVKLLFCSLVRSRLEYASVVWYPHQSYLKDMIEAIQKRFLRFLFFKVFGFYTFDVPYSQLLSIFELSSLDNRMKLMSLSYLYKLVNGGSDDACLLGQLCFNIPRQHSRNASTFAPRFSYTNLGYYSPLNNMCRLYNTFQADIFSLSSSSFMARLKKELNDRS
jgi:hypothetical protein